jgi:hypothetical protein
MPLKFWDEVFLTVVFLINHLPTPILAHVSPIAKLFDTKPAYSFLRTFGWACWPNLRCYNTNKLAFCFKQCAFLGYSTHHKGYKCLDISSGCVYISCDVVFDENVFPFTMLHANAGAHLRSEISLLPPSHLDSTSFGGRTVDTDQLPKSTDTFVQQCSLQGTTGPAHSIDRSILSSGSAYFLSPEDAALASDPTDTHDPGVEFQADLLGSPAPTSTMDEAPDSHPPEHAPAPDTKTVRLGPSLLPDHRISEVAASDLVSAPGADFVVDLVGSSTPGVTLLPRLHMATPSVAGFGAPLDGFFAPSGDPGGVSSSLDSSATPLPRAPTCLHNNIVKPKRLFPGMV